MNDIISGWLKWHRMNSHKFAFIHTIRAIYDRVVVVDILDNIVHIEYPIKRRKVWTIVENRILVKDICKMVYYQD